MMWRERLVMKTWMAALLWVGAVGGCSSESGGDEDNDTASAATGPTATDSGVVYDTGDSVAPDTGAADSATHDIAVPSDSGVVGTDSAVPATDTGVPASDTGAPPTDTGSPATDTGVPPTDTGSPATDTGVPPTDTGAPPTDTGSPATDTADTATQLPVPSGDGWTFCAAAGETCAFDGIMEVAIGNQDGFARNTHVDGVACDPQYFGPTPDPAPEGDDLVCYVRAVQTDCIPLRSLDEFRDALAQSGHCYRMKAGIYTVTELHEDKWTVMYAEGSNNTFDLTGVTIITPVALLSQMNRNPVHAQASYKLYGDNIAFINGTFENTYPNGMTDEEIDFSTYNSIPEYAPARQMAEFRVMGNGTRFTGTRFLIRGSYPYGYGDMFGKGAGSAVFLKKHAAIQVTGDDTVFDRVYVEVKAFGHGIFMQGADNTTIVDSMVVGRMRLGAEMYEDGPDSLPAQFNYEQQYPDYYVGVPIEKDRMYNLTEDGIRAYTSGTKLDGTSVRTGSITVRNTYVKNMRGCVTTTLAGGDVLIENVTIEGCSSGFSVPNGGVIRNSRGDASYGPLFDATYSSRHSAQVELELLDGPPATGDHPLMYLIGRGHEISLTYNGSGFPTPRPILIGDGGDRWVGDPDANAASGIHLVNATENPVILTEFATDNEVESRGPVTDNGSGNTVTSL